MSTNSGVAQVPTALAASDEATRAAATHLVAQLSIPREIPLRVPGVGEVVLCSRFLDRASARAWRTGSRVYAHAIQLVCADRSGNLFLESRLAVGWVNAILGLSPPPFAGSLTQIERGMLAGSIAATLAELGLASVLHLGKRVDAGTEVGTNIIALMVRLPSQNGQAWLEASDEFLAGIWAARGPGRGTFSPWLELAVTTIAESELSAARPGDMVVFDETDELLPDEPWPVRIHREECSIPAGWLGDGAIVATDNPSWVAATRPDRVVPNRRKRAGTAHAASAVTVAVGCTCPSIDPARPAPLVMPRASAVLLKVANRPWAYGEISAIDGALAVSITRKLAD